MSQWGQARHRLVQITLVPATAAHATAAPGGMLAVQDGAHVGCMYQVVLPDGRVVHESAMTLHGPAAQGSGLPADLVAALESLRQHAEQAISDREGLPPA